MQRTNPLPGPSVDWPVRSHELVFLLTKEPRYFYDAEAIREPAVGKLSNAAGPKPAIHSGKYESLRDPMVLAATKYARRKAPQSTTRHRRSVWVLSTEPYHGSHTATFPTKLVEPCVLAGTSAAGCCSHCGRPWERVLEISYQPLSERRVARRDRLVFGMEQRQVREARTTGWRPTCDCGADTVPAVVLDPFAGTGTALAVAKRLGRRAVGVELNDRYIRHIKRRCEAVRPAADQEEAA